MSEQVFPQEQDRLRSRAVAAIGVVAVVVVVLSLLVVAGILRAWQRPNARATLPLSRELGEGTPIDVTEIERDDHGPATRRAQREALRGFGWVDREQGVATIPIDVAMDLVVEGLTVEDR